MKVKVTGSINFERVVEVDDKYERVAEFFEDIESPNTWFGTGIAQDMEVLSVECATICTEMMEEEFGNDLHHHSINVYTLDDKIIFEE